LNSQRLPALGARRYSELTHYRLPRLRRLPAVFERRPLGRHFRAAGLRRDSAFDLGWGLRFVSMA
jgi:hypothetical protein